MFKNFLKKTIKLSVNINIITCGIGIASFYQINNFLKNPKESEDKENEKNQNLIKKQNFQYENFSKKFSNEENFVKNSYSDISSRNENLKKLESENFDVLIIGGGSAGAGVLIDAYTRGLKCGLIESFDFASGTSSRSSKLIHGGLRYLEEAFAFDFSKSFKERKEKFGLVNEALNERDFVRNSALFMNRSVELVIKSSNYLQLLYYYNGAFFYQLLYFITCDKSNKFKLKFDHFFPALKLDILSKKIFLYEGQFNDSRQNVLSILTCITENFKENSTKAAAANYIEFKDYIYSNDNTNNNNNNNNDSNSNTNKIIGIKAFDKIQKKEISIFSKVIVNCTGILSDNNFSKSDEMSNKMIRASKGSHLIFKNLNLKESIMIPKTSDGRVLFILPYEENYFLAGTTDAEDEKNLHPIVLEKEENFIIKEMANFSKEIFSEEILRKKISSKWAGERPLVCEKGFDDKTNSKSLSRSHVIRHNKDSNLYSLMGGKWTTYRNMGEEIVDEILKNEENLQKKENKCASKFLKLRGSLESYNEKFTRKNFDLESFFYENYLLEKLIKNFPDVEAHLIKNLVKRYGIYSLNVLLNGEKEKNNKVLCGDFLESEIRYVIRNEMALKPNDVICRRLGIGFLDDEISRKMIPFVSGIIGEEFNMEKSEVDFMTEEALRNFETKL